MSGWQQAGVWPQGGLDPELRGDNGIILKKNPDGTTTIALDERYRAALMIGQSPRSLSFDLGHSALAIDDGGETVQFRFLDPTKGLVSAMLDLDSASKIVDFLQGVLARSAEKMLAKTEEPR